MNETIKNGRSLYFVLILVAMFVVVGCGNDDDSDDGSDDGSDDDTGVKYTLSSVVPEPVSVTIDGSLGTIHIDLSDDALTDDQFTNFLTYMNDGTITLTVINDETSVSYNLSEGTNVDDDPASEGEFNVSMVGDSVDVVFWNDFMGSVIAVGGDYSASISVMSNDDFTTESFVSDVLVQ